MVDFLTQDLYSVSMSTPNNRFLFTGEEAFLLHRDLTKRTTWFQEKYGTSTFFSYRADDITLDNVRQAFQWGGMFSEKTMLVLWWIPKDTTPTNKTKADGGAVETYLIDHRDQLPDDLVLVLVSYKPDKRTKAWKFFQKVTTIKSYPATKEKDALHIVASWMSADRWGKIDIPYLLQKTWTNLYRVYYECDKLLWYARHHQLTELTHEHIDKIVVPQEHDIGFRILDTLFHDTAATYGTLWELEHQQEDPFKILGLLARGLKLILGMVDLYQHGTRAPKEIASSLKVHPFPVLKQFSHIKRYVAIFPSIRRFYGDVLRIETDVKQGKLAPALVWWRLKALLAHADR